MTPFERFREGWRPLLVAKLDEHVSRLSWSADQIRIHQRDQLRELLGYAIARSPFHRERLAGIEPSRFDLDDLPRLPVMKKPEMMDRLGDVFTDRQLTFDAVEHALGATRDVPVPIDGRFLAMASGGSSGRRGVFVLDPPALVDYVASGCRGALARTRAAGNVPPGGLSIAMVAAASAVHATGTLPGLASGDPLPFQFVNVPVTLPLDEIVKRLDALSPHFLNGYPTMLARLAEEKRAGRLRLAPLTIAATSENLTPGLRETITDAFGVPVVDVFGSTEGLIGSTAPADPVHSFNSDICIVELVDHDDKPVPDGTTSDKVLITNLSNRLQPLIRYELSDRFTRQPGAAEHGHFRATVQGRADDVLHYPRVDIHPHVLRSVLVTEPAVLDYQIRQTQGGVEVLAVTRGAIDIEGLCRAMARALGAAGLLDPEVGMRLVPALERLAESGKIQRVVMLRAPDQASTARATTTVSPET